MSLPLADHPAFYADEIGVLHAMRGDLRLRSQYRPVYVRGGDAFVPVGVEASLAVSRAGQDCGTQEAADDALRGDAEAMLLAPALHLFNRVHLDMAPACFFIEMRADWPRTLLEALDQANEHALTLGEAPLPPRSVVCRIASRDACDIDAAGLQALSAAGMRLCVDGFELADGSLRMPGLWPAVAELSGPRLAELARYPEANRLLAPLVSSFKRQGVTVLAHDIASAGELRNAVAAGMDWFSGPFLGAFQPAGAELDLMPKPLGGLLPERRLRLVSTQP